MNINFKIYLFLNLLILLFIQKSILIQLILYSNHGQLIKQYKFELDESNNFAKFSISN